MRSSRQIHRRCTEDLAFQVLAGNQTPDHVTIARFRARHQQALAGFLVESLKLCAAADRPLWPIKRPNRRPFEDVVHRDHW